MSTGVFFEAERARFFRPLNSSRRELVAACLRALYDRLHGPAADYAHNLSRDALKDLLLPVVRDHQDQLAPDAEQDEFNTPDGADPAQLTGVVIRALLADGWLEQFADRHGLVTAFRFSRPGKLFAEALWSLDRPSRSRQRNMRGCRNALEAGLSERGDAHDLVDAYEYAEKVIEDLTDGIDYFQELVRHLMQTASVHTQWNEFVEFLDRFQRDYSKQLTADNATLNRQAIRQKIEKLRVVPENKIKRVEAQLHDIAQWAVKERTGPSVYDWLLYRIEDIVDAACESKQPGFLKAMETYLKRVNGLALQSMMLRSGQTRHAYLAAIQRVSETTGEAQDKLLAQIGERLASAEIRLLDPSSFKLRTATQRRKAVTVSIQPRPSREARLAAAMHARRPRLSPFRTRSWPRSCGVTCACSGTRFACPRFRHRRPATSSEPCRPLAVRNARGNDLVARKLPTRLDNEFYSGTDYEIDFRK